MFYPPLSIQSLPDPTYKKGAQGDRIPPLPRALDSPLSD